MAKSLRLNGSWLKAQRLKRCLSQEAMASQSRKAACHLSLSTIKRAESGAPVSCRSAASFAQFFDLSVADLVLELSAGLDNAPCHKPASALCKADVTPSLRPLATPAQAQATPALFVARELEQAQFAQLCRSSQEHSKNAVCHLLAPMGWGKTALMTTLAANACAQGFVVSHIKTERDDAPQEAIDSHHDGDVLPLSVLHNLLLAESSASSGVPERIGQTCHLPPAAVTQLLSILPTLACASQPPGASTTDSHRTLCQILCQISGPRLWVLDDAHQIPLPCWQLLQGLLALLVNAPVILLLSARPSQWEKAGYWAHNLPAAMVMTLDLLPLPTHSMQQLLRYWCDKAMGSESEPCSHHFANKASMDKAYPAYCLMQARGNPLFLKQLLLASPMDITLPPPAIVNEVARLLSALRHEAQQVICVASLLETRIDRHIIDRVLGRPGYSDGMLDRVCNSLLVMEAGRDIRFIEPLLKAAVYQSIRPEQKYQWHRKIALCYGPENTALSNRHLLRCSYLLPFARSVDSCTALPLPQSMLIRMDIVQGALLSAPDPVLGFRLALLKGELLLALDMPHQAIGCLRRAESWVDSWAESWIESGTTAPCQPRHRHYFVAVWARLALAALQAKRFDEAYAFCHRLRSEPDCLSDPHVMAIVSACEAGIARGEPLPMALMDDNGADSSAASDGNNGPKDDKKHSRKACMDLLRFDGLDNAFTLYSGRLKTSGSIPQRPGKKTVTVALLQNASSVSSSVLRAVLLAVNELNTCGGVSGSALLPVPVTIEQGQMHTVAGCEQQGATHARPNVIFCCTDRVSTYDAEQAASLSQSLCLSPLPAHAGQGGGTTASRLLGFGVTLAQRVQSALMWLQDEGKQRLMVVASDTPRSRHHLHGLKQHCQRSGHRLVGAVLISPVNGNGARLIKHIMQWRPDGIISLVAGEEGNRFLFKTLYEQRLSVAALPVLSLALSVSDLHQLPPAHVCGAWLVAACFEDADSAHANPITGCDVMVRYRDAFGQPSIMDDEAISAYCGVHLWAKAVRLCASLDPVLVKQAMRGLIGQGPGGMVWTDEVSGRLWRRLHVARVDASGTCRIRWTSPWLMPPDPGDAGGLLSTGTQSLSKSVADRACSLTEVELIRL